jgi:hypothetical protein
MTVEFVDSNAQCRLCDGHPDSMFSLMVLGRHKVDYFRCAGCGSLQTQSPHWPEEAYQNSLAALDTGAGQRNLTNLGAAAAVAAVLGFKNILDYGG